MGDYDYLLEEKLGFHNKPMKESNKTPFYTLLALLILNVLYLYYTIYVGDVVSSLVCAGTIGTLLFLMIFISR